VTEVQTEDNFQAQLIELMPALRSFARRFYAKSSDIDDLVQDTIVKALSNSDKFEDGTRLKSWLFTIMRNRFCTNFKLAKRERVGLDENIGDRPTTPASQDWAIACHELEGAMDRLPEKYRAALDMIIIQGFSYETAANRSGCPVGTMKSRVNRARMQLAVDLQ